MGGGGGGGFFIENPRRGGAEGPGGCLQRIGNWRGGANFFFFRGRTFHQVTCSLLSHRLVNEVLQLRGGTWPKLTSSGLKMTNIGVFGWALISIVSGNFRQLPGKDPRKETV